MQTKLTLSELKTYVDLTYYFVDKGALSALLQNDGYIRDAVNSDLVLHLILNNSDFAQAYVQLFEQARNDRSFIDAVDNNLISLPSLNGADGSEIASNAVGDKGNPVMEWFDKIGGFLVNGTNAVGGLLSVLDVSGSGAANSAAALALAQAEQERVRAQQTKTVILIVGAVVALIILAVIFLTVRK